MGRASIKINPGDSHMSENMKSPYHEDTRRLERRWKRWEAMNDSLKHNRFASAPRTTVKICENMDVLTDQNDPMIEEKIDEDNDIDSSSNIDVNTCYNGNNDEIDEEYKIFFPTYDPDIDSASDNDVGGSDIDVDTGYNSNNDSIDENYELFLPTYDPDIDSASDNNVEGEEEEEEEEEEERLHNKLKLDTKMSKDLQRSTETRNADEEYQLILNYYEAFYTPDSQGGTDKDYQLFCIVDKNTTKTTTVEDGSNSYSTDSELILIEPNPICENTPFISSKRYDSSWFEKEMNPRDARQLSADDHSQFRRRLMEYLERPYDQQEYVTFLQEVYQRKQKERHVETRQGVVKSYRAKGVNKSYLELYPDLAKAIAEFKGPHRVLFLLRGFIFWLQNLSHEGIFRPWLDELCLETLRKM